MRKSKKNFIKIIKNNLMIFNYSLTIVPLFTFMSCFGRAFHAILIFFEHTYMTKFIIDCIQFERPFCFAFIYIISIFLATTLWLLFLNYYNAKYYKKNVEILIRAVRIKIYSKAKDVHISAYDDPEFFNDYVWSMKEIDARVNNILNTISAFLTGLFNILTCGVFMISYDYIGLLCVIISFIGTFILNIKIGKFQYNINIKARPYQRKQDYISRVLYMKEFSKDIRLSNIKDKLYSDYYSAYKEIVNIAKNIGKKIALFSFLSNYVFDSLLFNGVYITYLVFKTTIKKSISFGSMAALFQSCGTLKNGLNSLTNSLPKFYENSLYIEKINSFLATKSYSYKELSNQSIDIITSIEIQNVSFAYPNTNNFCLKNISLTINSKQKIAIVGYNGAGKSTLINLLLRLYEVTSGKILINGKNSKEFDLRSYQSNFGVLFQDFQIYAASISENVVMNDTESKQHNSVTDVLTLSGFDDKLRKLKNGVNTILTREYDDEGVELSGGEAQKIALARSIYKNSQVIILDEPSSALDPISEYKFNRTIADIAREKIVIYISHRLSTTKMADKIYMFDNGEIIEEGNHDELMALGGKYCNMFTMQAEKYKNRVMGD